MNDFIVRINDNLREVKIIDENFAEVDDKRVEYRLIELNHSKFVLKIDNKVYEAAFWKNSNDELSLQINNNNFDVNIRTVLQEKAFQLLSASQKDETNVKSVKSPMPGLVLKILKNVGDKITKGDTVMILEAMKMENEIKSNIDGTIAEIFVIEGKPVEKYISLFSIK
jgi:biotin carboxyl carrier protein